MDASSSKTLFSFYWLFHWLLFHAWQPELCCGTPPTMGASFHEVGSQIFRESNPQGVKVVLLNFFEFLSIWIWYKPRVNVDLRLLEWKFKDTWTWDFTTSITQKSCNLKRDNVESECAPKYITLNLIFHIFDNNSKLGHLWMEKRDLSDQSNDQYPSKDKLYPCFC